MEILDLNATRWREAWTVAIRWVQKEPEQLDTDTVNMAQQNLTRLLDSETQTLPPQIPKMDGLLAQPCCQHKKDKNSHNVTRIQSQSAWD